MNYNKLVQLIKIKNDKGDLIIPFESKFFCEEEMKYSHKEELRKLLWMEELRQYIQDNFKYYITVTIGFGIDPWWSCYIDYLLPPESDRIFDTIDIDNSWNNYSDALCEGLTKCCEIIIMKYK